MSGLPISTQWLQEAITTSDRDIIMSIALIQVNSTQMKGTGWLISEKYLITNEHVIRNSVASDITLIFPDDSKIKPTSIIQDPITDLAALLLPSAMKFKPLEIDLNRIQIGSKICTWGHPLGYSGPAPILSVGYLAGFNSHTHPSLGKPQKRLILNAALNPGNSGGPILIWEKQAVCGVAVTKHAPISAFLQSAINALSTNRTGVAFNATDDNGNEVSLSESQLVSHVLQYFRSMTQVVIGEAISSNDLKSFLDNNQIPYSIA